VAVGEQLCRAAPAPDQDSDEIDRQRVLDHLPAMGASLARVVERDRVVLDVDVLLADRRRADAGVLVGVLLAADTEHADVEQAHRQGEHALAARLLPVP
jgi:hypothetical protein